MIKKNFEIGNLDQSLNIILFYGKNEGAKKEEIAKLLLKNKDKQVFSYDEKQVLDNSENFYNEILSKSLFNNKKIIIINRTSDKFTKIIEELITRDTSDTLIIINAAILEKKSKLRLLFEKEKKLVCVAFYPDNQQVLTKITLNFLREKKITLSQENINLIINRCNGDREILKNELEKIELFNYGEKKITTEDILKLTNLVENYSISELTDNCLAKNKKKTVHILNENNFNSEDCIVISRSFLSKAKRILKLSEDYQKNKDLNKTIDNAKPPIFWKDKEIVKQQLNKWKTYEINELIYDLNEIELKIKKGNLNPLNIISDFILNKSSTETNNYF